MRASNIHRTLFSAIGGMALVAGSLAVAPASTAVTTTYCRASLIRTGPGPGLEPVVANANGSPCTTQNFPISEINPVYVEVPDLTGGGAPAAFVELSDGYARTDSSPQPGKTERGNRAAEAGAAALTIRLRGVDASTVDGPGYIDIDGLTSSASCNLSESAVGKVGFVWAGIETEVPGGPVPATITLPGGAGTMYLNRRTVTGATVTQQALVLDLASQPDDLVVAETIASC